MVRCIRCGRELTAEKSVERGIGPTCWEKIQEAKANALDEYQEQADIYDYVQKKIQGGKLQLRIGAYDALKLPCNDYTCRECPFAAKKKCPRERVFLKRDLRPKYKNRVKTCSFCGDSIIHPHRIYKHETKRTIECKKCYEKNKEWRSQSKFFRKQNNIEEVIVHV
jgi:hypothetical protein